MLDADEWLISRKLGIDAQDDVDLLAIVESLVNGMATRHIEHMVQNEFHYVSEGHSESVKGERLRTVIAGSGEDH